MNLSVRVIPRSSQEKIIEESERNWKVYLHTSPERGKANQRLRELIAEKLHISKSKIKIIRGETKPFKIIEVSHD